MTTALDALVHPTAEIEPGVAIGPGTAIWAHAHLRGPASIGADVIIGEKTYVAYDVVVADRVKLNAMVYVCAGVTIETGVMVGAGTVFTNDRFPRATTPDLLSLRPSEPDEHTLATRIRQGASIGAGCVIGCDLEVGPFAMVGMGTVVTRSVPAYTLVVGNPARPIAYVCRCGKPFARVHDLEPGVLLDVACADCGYRYHVDAGVVAEVAP